MSEHHRDDQFHPPTSDDPYWTETCWFTLNVPERRLSGQLYPFFRPNQGVLASGAYCWDHTEWTFDGLCAFGEDHDNWSAAGIRRFLRSRRTPDSPDDQIHRHRGGRPSEVHPA